MQLCLQLSCATLLRTDTLFTVHCLRPCLTTAGPFAPAQDKALLQVFMLTAYVSPALLFCFCAVLLLADLF